MVDIGVLGTSLAPIAEFIQLIYARSYPVGAVKLACEGFAETLNACSADHLLSALRDRFLGMWRTRTTTHRLRLVRLAF